MPNPPQHRRVSSIKYVNQFSPIFLGWYEPFPKQDLGKKKQISLLKLIDFNLPKSQSVIMEYERPISSLFQEVYEKSQNSFKKFWLQLIGREIELEEAPNNDATAVVFPYQHDFQFNRVLQNFLAGRILLLKECQEFELEDLKSHFLAGFIGVTRGIQMEKGIPVCQRCGNRKSNKFARHFCERCGEECLYCRECIEMGQIRACTPLLTWAGPDPEPFNGLATLAWEGKLTVEQVEASTKLSKSVERQEDFLEWAVCGSGKTEILYETIQTLIERKKRVALVAPRTDVILELDRRLEKVFPTIPRVALYSDTPTPYKYTPLMLGTLHQLRRFEQAFDLIIIDEVDAFPFNGNRALEVVLNRALKPNASKVFVTATPTRKVKHQYLNGRLNGIHIPIRFHRAPLPEPTFQYIGDWRKNFHKGRLPKLLYKWLLECSKKERRVFLFVPEIRQVEVLVQLLKEKQLSAEGAHSKDPNRREKVLAFREGKHHIMVTTTILERGVTIPFADVGVLGAENPVFDERALVQMAGRSGRDAKDPNGQVIFFHNGKTLEMARARSHIRFMNKEGDKLR